MQTSVITARGQALLSKAAPMPKASRKQTIIRAAAAASDEAQPQSRRAALAFFAASMIGLGAVEAAQANAAAPKSATAASMSSYNMEGTKKQGISAKRKAKLLAKARAAAEKASK